MASKFGKQFFKCTENLFIYNYYDYYRFMCIMNTCSWDVYVRFKEVKCVTLSSFLSFACRYTIDTETPFYCSSPKSLCMVSTFHSFFFLFFFTAFFFRRNKKNSFWNLFRNVVVWSDELNLSTYNLENRKGKYSVNFRSDKICSRCIRLWSRLRTT